MIQKTGAASIPVITVGSEFVIGFDRAKLEKLLGL